jgi:heme-degrading monooxygenase HmoA
MHARSGRVDVPPDRIDDAVAALRDQQIPLYRDAQGYKGFTALANRESGAILGVSFWESEADRDASEQLGAESRQKMAEAAGIQEQMVRESWEVVFDDAA